MSDTEPVDMYTCPKNGCDLRGQEIPAKYREWHGNQTHYSNMIGIYDQERDRTVGWKCGVCGHQWPRE
jgi:hypothetical protein